MQSRFGEWFKALSGADARVYVALLLATLIYCPMLFGGLDRYGRRDWDQFTFRYETPRAALLRDHELPLWNPYVNGGTVLMAHPDSPFPSPWFALVLALGAPIGLRVQVVVFMAIGAIGAATLLRRWGLPPAARVLGGVLFMMSAHFALQIAEGHLEWCVLGLMPWVILAVIRSFSDRRFVLVAGLLLSSVLMFGSVYIMAVYVPFVSMWMILESLKRRSWKPVVSWAAAILLMAVLSAVKLLPQMEFTGANPRERKAATIGLHLKAFGPMLLDPRQDLFYKAIRDVESGIQAKNRGVVLGVRPSLPEPIATSIAGRLRRVGVTEEWHEYGIYVTWLGLALAACGLVVSWRSQWPLYVSGVTALITAMANGSAVDTWALLQQLPLYSSLTVPSRFLAAVAFVLAVASAYGLSWVSGLVPQHRRSLGLVVKYGVPLVVFAELASLGWRLWGDVFVFPPIPVASHSSFAVRSEDSTHYYPGMYSYTYPLIAANSGILRGYENVQVTKGVVALEGGPRYRGEVYLEQSGRPVSILKRSMSKLNVQFKVDGPDALVLNQNYYSGWRARVRGARGVREQLATPNAAGLVSVALYEGDVEAYVHYLPQSFIYGLWVSAASWAACVGLLLWRIRGSRNSVGGKA